MSASSVSKPRSAAWALVFLAVTMMVSFVPRAGTAASSNCGKVFSKSGTYSGSCSLTYMGNPLAVTVAAVGTAPSVPCMPLGTCEPDMFAQVIVYDPSGSSDDVFCTAGVVVGTAGIPLVAACAKSGNVGGFHLGDTLVCLAVASNYGTHGNRSVRGFFHCSSHAAVL